MRSSNEKERIDRLMIVFSFCNCFDLSSIVENCIKIIILLFFKESKESNKQIVID
jgi:hypothetical protein